MGMRKKPTAFWTTPVNIQKFTTNFTFQLSSAKADGFTFNLQNAGPTAVSGTGGGLGYGPDPLTATPAGIATSVAIKFDFYDNSVSAYATPTYLRLQRAGTTYTVYWSTNGTTWTQFGTFTDSLVVTGLAPYAGNYSSPASQATGLTAKFDWFHNRATDGP